MTKQMKKQSVKQNKGTGHTVAGVIAMLVLAFSSIVVNANGAAWGGAAGFDSFLTTLFFILFWSMFIVIYKSIKTPVGDFTLFDWQESQWKILKRLRAKLTK